MEKTGKLIRGNEERIHVSVRLRPLSDQEVLSNDVSNWECINDDTIIFKNLNPLATWRSMHPTAFTFDRVFDTTCSTREVYEHGAKDVVISVVRGINSTVFAYGQKCSGKTYTMARIAEYAMADIYEYIEKRSTRDFVLKFSAMEVYNESVRDLLGSDTTPLRLLDDAERGTIVENLTEEILRDRNHANELLSICRVSARSNIGDEIGSGTHHIIRLSVESLSREFSGGNNTSSSTLAATLNFVDLAASDDASRTLSGLKEAHHGNRSLVTLETVIHKLSNDPNGHIPYRDSKLTRILETSLGGNSRTALICTMNPGRRHVGQSKNTLVFAGHAKEVGTKAQVNVVVHDMTLVRHLQTEVERLEMQLKNSLSDVGPSHYHALLRGKDEQIEKLEKEIKDLILQRDIAQSQVKEFIQILGHDVTSVVTQQQIGCGQYPHLRVQKSDSDIDKREGSPLADHRSDADSTSSTEDHIKVPFFEDGFDHGYTSPRILLTSSTSSSYHASPDAQDRAFSPSVQTLELNQTDNNGEKEWEFSGVQYLDEGSCGEKGLNLGRSCSLTSDSSSPPFKAEEFSGDTPGIGLERESEVCHGQEDCHSPSQNAPNITTDGKFLEDEDETSSDRDEKMEPQSEEMIKPAAAEEEESGDRKIQVGMTSWPVEFRRLQREILELWHGCNVSLLHRTYFFLLFQGDPSDAIYLEVEMRRMKFLRDKFSRGDKAVVDGRTLTLSSSAKSLRQERRSLSEQMSKKYSEKERENLFGEWGIGLNTKLRRLQLAHLVWSKTDDISHVSDSAFLVARLVGLVDPAQPPNKDAAFPLNFTYKCSAGITTFKRSLVSIL